MKIAVGIIGIALALIALMQSCTITGLSGLAEDQAAGEAGALGMLTALLMFFGGAFAFGVPRVAQILFVAAFFVSIPARENFPDMWVWGIISAALAVLLFFHKKSVEGKSPQEGKGSPDAETKTYFDVVLKSPGASKINLIKEIRGITGLGLKEAKDLVEADGPVIKKQVSPSEAKKIKARLESVGANVMLK